MALVGTGLGDVWIALKGNDAHFQTMMRRTDRSLKGMAMRAGALAAAVTKLGVVIGAVVGYASLKAFAAFDDAMTQSTAIMGDLDRATRQAMETVARDLAVNGVKSATELAGAYYYLASAGLDAQQSIAALPVVEKFATAGMFDMRTATDLLAGSLGALGKSSKDAQTNMKNMNRLGNLLVKANTLSQASVEQFARALGTQAGATMKNFNIQTEDGIAVLAAYAKQMVRGEKAGTMFSRMVRLLSKAVLENEREWKKLRINVFDDAGELLPFSQIIANLSRVLEPMSTKTRAATLALLGFQARSQQAILPLIGMHKELEGWQKELVGAGDIMDEVRQKQLQSFTSQLKIAWSNIKDVGIILGAAFGPAVGKNVRILFQNMRDWFVANESDVKAWAKGVLDAVKSVIDGLFAVQDWLKQNMPKVFMGGTVRKAAKERADLEYRLEAERRGNKQPFKNETVGAFAAGPGGGGFATTRQVPTDETLYNTIYDRILRETEEMSDDVQATWDKAYKTVEEMGMGASGELGMRTAEAAVMPEPSMVDLSGLAAEADAIDAIPFETQEEIQRAMEDLYGGLRQQGDDFARFQQKQLDEQVQRYKGNIDQLVEYNTGISKALMDTGALSDEDIAKFNAEKAALEALIEKYEEHQQVLLDINNAKSGNDFFAGMRAGFQEMSLNMETLGQLGYNMAQELQQGVVQSLSDAVLKAEDLGDALRNVGMQLAEMAMQWAISGLFSTAMGGIGGALGGGDGGGGGLFGGLLGGIGSALGGGDKGGGGSLFSGGGGGGGTVSTQMKTQFTSVGLAHSGAIVTHAPTINRILPSSVFVNAPRAHGGIGPDERPMVLRKDEGVFTPEQMAALGPGMDSGRMEAMLGQVVQVLQQKQNINANIVDHRNVVTEEMFTTRRGEEMVMAHVRRNQI